MLKRSQDPALMVFVQAVHQVDLWYRVEYSRQDKRNDRSAAAGFVGKIVPWIVPASIGAPFRRFRLGRQKKTPTGLRLSRSHHSRVLRRFGGELHRPDTHKVSQQTGQCQLPSPLPVRTSLPLRGPIDTMPLAMEFAITGVSMPDDSYLNRSR